uniref:Ribosomal protein S14 n=1 Tax=Romanomermis culicivorax TaxID=13658 RepID=A0A915L112_ROMCU
MLPIRISRNILKRKKSYFDFDRDRVVRRLDATRGVSRLRDRLPFAVVRRSRALLDARLETGLVFAAPSVNAVDVGGRLFSFSVAAVADVSCCLTSFEDESFFGLREERLWRLLIFSSWKKWKKSFLKRRKTRQFDDKKIFTLLRAAIYLDKRLNTMTNKHSSDCLNKNQSEFRALRI